MAREDSTMKTTYFRGKPLINRDKEKNFIKNYFTKIPQKVLWIYGPKSTGKTTLIEYIVKNEHRLNKIKFLSVSFLPIKRIKF